MHRALLTSAAAAALLIQAGPASAADIPMRARAPVMAPVMAPPVYNWTGLYVGVNGGGAWGRSSWDSTGSFDVTGGLVGGTLGYNLQMGPAVWGIEGDLDYSAAKGSAACGAGTCESAMTWLGTARGDRSSSSSAA